MRAERMPVLGKKGEVVTKGSFIEAFHLSMYALCGLRDAEYDAMSQTLDDVHFQAHLRRMVRRLFRR